MDTKRVSSITIKFDDNTSLKVQEQKKRLLLAAISNKYHELLKKCKIKEPISATNGN